MPTLFRDTSAQTSGMAKALADLCAGREIEYAAPEPPPAQTRRDRLLAVVEETERIILNQQAIIDQKEIARIQLFNESFKAEAELKSTQDLLKVAFERAEKMEAEAAANLKAFHEEKIAKEKANKEIDTLIKDGEAGMDRRDEQISFYRFLARVWSLAALAEFMFIIIQFIL